ncbi:cytochrome C family oxidase subunit III subfamily protein [Toxoplasma gondii RUB]|uniref:Cytochrome C family oxidase subunit III subfamily protein n=3 Tax=Toxoplasma gondii TaxID=5811 RepID=A0A086LJ33_TOXGO|nr:cytochrome C family oxidase subunit III subfamily protein [Toxoplasma gondii FOU]KFG56651.1 cytochrome C family oxidase subunit III subfamily protein [Toxoplasma gondii RUB]
MYDLEVLVLTARENYYSDASLISTVVLGVIISETGLFISFFWGVYTTSWTTGLGLEGLCLPDPSSIVLFMTIMLSALSIVASSVYVKNQHLCTSCTNIMIFTLVVSFLYEYSLILGVFLWLLKMGGPVEHET